MTEQPSTLYAKLLGQTAPIAWQELQPYFAKGALLWVEADQDLIEVAQAMVENDSAKVSSWLSGGHVTNMTDEQAQSVVARDPQLWAVVVAPWVLVQERMDAPNKR
ncbi:DUF2288 domain-containing protein [Pseudomonas sp. M30-35]|uniref:DUF2288 domain-containing protein n=1 Tax=Pseudomonas sp. M30-35 TaxID=1981174 RepID=UPI000B3C6E4B|nr:DUF2288 domain-containing protein [Pseudomonas sp. M30-35]ARU89319.1 hypothetical protein B9K09_15695 [Pseudomonas sp. M30-35]